MVIVIRTVHSKKIALLVITKEDIVGVVTVVLLSSKINVSRTVNSKKIALLAMMLGMNVKAVSLVLLSTN
jgi:hypothetical protein